MAHKTLEARREYMRRYRRERGVVPLGSDEQRAKVSAAIAEHWKTRPRRGLAGDKNPNWRGDGVGWSALHKWLRRNHPKRGVCSECDKKGKTDWAFLRHPEPYTRNANDYRELCRSCHIKFDR